MDDVITVSSFAASQPRMNMGFRKGQNITLREAILSVIVRSANDSAVALAEEVSGSQSAFADKMNLRAKQLGMVHTVFRNASGLPNSEQKTTAYDLARLAIALRRDFPEYYPLFSRTNFVYNGKTYQGHNRVTSNYPGCDGLKTGFVNASGFNLVSSAVQGDTKLVAVVLGGATARSRDKQMVSLLDRFLGRAPAQENYSDNTDNSSPVRKVSKKQKSASRSKIYKEQASNSGKHKKNYASAPRRKSAKPNQEVAGL
jgi:D-alanyl-D-alanine carboxypeptidase